MLPFLECLQLHWPTPLKSSVKLEPPLGILKNLLTTCSILGPGFCFVFSLSGSSGSAVATAIADGLHGIRAAIAAIPSSWSILTVGCGIERDLFRFINTSYNHN